MRVADHRQLSEDTIRLKFTGVTNIARTLACILVVIVHINIYVRPAVENWWPGGFIGTPIYATAVPLFFLISGFSAGHYAGGVHRGVLTFYRRKRNILIVPFFVWNAIIIALLCIGSGFPSVGVITYQLLTGAWQLYYVFALLQMLLLNFYFGRYFAGRFLNSALLVAFIVSFVFYALADLSVWIIGDSSTIFERDLNRIFFPWIFFFVLGAWLRRKPAMIEWLFQKRYWLILFSVISWISYSWELFHEAQWIGYNPLKQFLITGFAYQVFMPLLLLLSIYWLVKSEKLRGFLRVLAWAGRDTYAIYLCHTTVLLLIFPFWYRHASFIPYCIEVPILAACVWTTSCLLIHFIVRFRLHHTGRVLFGFIIKR